MTVYSAIAGTGSFIPERIVPNSEFLDRTFYQQDGSPYPKPTAEIVANFERITGIRERRYVENSQTLGDIALLAAKAALDSSGTDPKNLDGIIAAHDSGELVQDGNMTSLALELKKRLGATNILYISEKLAGCSGWIKALIEADEYIKGGAKRMLVVGAEVMSPYLDRHDRDSMIFADGAGAVVLQQASHAGILAHTSKKDENNGRFWFAHSYGPEYELGRYFLHMNGQAVYEDFVRSVPNVVVETLEMAELQVNNLSKLFIHQANGRMVEKAARRILREHNRDIADLVPMTVSTLGNSSVATVPTLLDLVSRGEMPGHTLNRGDYIALVSVGAAINVDCVVYRVA